MDFRERRLLEYFSTFLSDTRKEAMEQVLQGRTRHITVVLEDIYQAQNASAVVRTCDCFGIQDLHIIENLHTYKLNPRVVHGASKWINIHRYNEGARNTSECIENLRSKGYRLVGTTPDSKARKIHDLTITPRTALIFGTEASGLSQEALKSVDELVTYPMYGFTESLNISVSVSLCLSELIRQLRLSGLNWGLSEDEKDEIRLEWYRKSVNRHDILEKEFLKKLQ